MSDSMPPRQAGPAGVRPPAPEECRWVRVLYAGNAAERRIGILGQAVLGVYCHWVEGHTRPCLRPLGRCQCVEGGWAPMWKGYVHGITDTPRKEVVLEITEHAWQHCPELRAADGDLRGRTVEVTKANRSRRAPQLVKLLPGRAEPTDWPAVDVLTCLSHLWGISRPALAHLAGMAERLELAERREKNGA